MQSILEEKFEKRIKIKNEFLYDFDISKTGLYVVEITGRAKSWLQNTLGLISFFKDDDLAVKNVLKFLKLLILPLIVGVGLWMFLHPITIKI